MGLAQTVPDYLVTRRNTIIQTAFTAVFAYIFINIYRPFGYENWYQEVYQWQLLLASAVVILTGMIVIILSRVFLFYIKRSHEITFAVYAWFIVAEILFMGLFFTSFEIFILKDERPALALLFNAVQNTALILLIPYTLTILFFAWTDIKKKLDKVVQQFRDPSELFIPFHDEKGQLRISVKCADLIFMEANDNYVNLHYLSNGKQKVFMIRNSLKNFEESLKDYPLARVHRKFAVNTKNVKMLRKGKKSYELIMNTNEEEVIPVSKKYERQVIKVLNQN
ncbi:LytR/AlgR family response regulator transcription factor [Roseimarinus sediminis]|jgi:hypothetical protein|uniref:LytR/AlgR family response regulator transcription factor n=1 Tax=Roseimarinus sediminis TaxID=1610899 RepID=UPI003D2525A3